MSSSVPSAVESPEISRSEIPGGHEQPPSPLPESSEEFVGSFSVQGGVGFGAGGLLALVFMLASAVQGLEALDTAGPYLGFGLGGAIGGASLAWGFSRKHACRAAALGFSMAFLIPAYLAAPAVTRLLSMEAKDYGPGTFVGTLLAFAVAYGLGGAIGSLFLLPRLFWPGAVRFCLAGVVGGLVAATAPSFIQQPDGVTAGHMFLMLVTTIFGHILPFVLGGILLGRVLVAEEHRLRRNRA